MPISVKHNDTFKLVFNVYQKIAGEWVECTALYYKFAGVWKLAHLSLQEFVFTTTLTGTVYNYNMRAQAIAAGWNGISPLRAFVTLQNATVRATGPNFAFSSGITFPEGSKLELTIDSNSKVIGRGANGGNSGSNPVQQAGSAIFINLPTDLHNTGVIGGGGGAGGGGGTIQCFSTSTGAIGYAGGGGAGGGAGGSIGGNAAGLSGTINGATISGQTLQSPTNGTNGTETSAGFGGQGLLRDKFGFRGDGSEFRFLTGAGGAGGALGSSGANGSPAVVYYNIGGVRSFTALTQGFGSPAGLAIVGMTFVNILNLGTIYGNTSS